MNLLDSSLGNVTEVNFDTTLWNRGRVIGACVMHNATGKLLLVVSFPCDCCEVDEAELRSAWEDVRLMKEYFPDCPLCLEGDALSVTQKLLARSSSQAVSVILEGCSLHWR